ncbi:MAG: Rieske 2Fe-2S domain-containing protein [Lautropia sp.]
MAKVTMADVGSTQRGTLAGRYMRMFWQPIHLLAGIAPGQAKPLQIMGERYTLYRGDSGEVHLADERCAHRGTLLHTGWVEGDSIRCRYHGWRYAADGQCVEQPGERDKPFCETVHIRSWPLRVFHGLVFAYLGEGEAPAFPEFSDVEDPHAVVECYVYYRRCNYFNAIDNTLDAVHVSFTHKEIFSAIVEVPALKTVDSADGVLLYSDRHSGTRANEFLVPNILRTTTPFGQGENKWTDYIVWRVPVDDHSHLSFSLTFAHVPDEPARQEYARAREKVRALPVPPVDALADRVLAGELTLEAAKASMGEHDPYYDIILEDHVMLIGQENVLDRRAERLGRADAGVIAVRRRWLADLQRIADETQVVVPVHTAASRATVGV